MLMILARLVLSESFWAVVKVRSPHTVPEVWYPRLWVTTLVWPWAKRSVWRLRLTEGAGLAAEAAEATVAAATAAAVGPAVEATAEATAAAARVTWRRWRHRLERQSVVGPTQQCRLHP